MVKTCIFCMDPFVPNTGRTFHIFPSQEDLRQKWFHAIGVRYTASKYIYLCSDHFAIQDICVKPGGRKYLRQGAIPQVASRSFVETETVSLGIKRIRSGTNENSKMIASSPASSPANKIARLRRDFESPSVTSSSSTVTVESPTFCDQVLSSVLRDHMSPNSNSTSTASESPRLLVTNEKTRALMTATTSSGKENVIPSPQHSQISRSSSSTITLAEPEKDIYLLPHTKRYKKPRYFGNCDNSVMMKSKRILRNWEVARKTIKQQQIKIRQLQQTKRRLKMRVCSLKSLVVYLKQNYFISESAESIINASLPGSAAEIMKRILKGQNRQKYSPELRMFALTLNFYSSKAYNYVREKFCKSLPSSRTLSEWYRSVDGTPGFTKEAVEALKVKASNASTRNKQLLCNLVFDEMSIRRLIEWTGKKFTGFVDIGTNINSENIPEAKEVVVFMLVCLNENWKLTIGYFLIDGLSGLEKANLVNQCLTFIQESGVIVTSVTFDGASSNLNMVSALGADFSNPLQLNTKFKNPVNEKYIHLFLDPCHMIKLVRNCVASCGNLQDGDGNSIEWKYFEYLVELQNTEGLNAATKLKNRHIRWDREKMKVKIAVQTLSNSVADALLFLCCDLKNEKFKGAEATAKFVKIFNNLFDIFNCRNLFSKSPFRKPLSDKTQEEIFTYLQYCIQYIIGLKLNGKPLVRTNRKVGFLGFLVCIESLKNMYVNYINCDQPLLKYILTYKLSQDHIEIYFSMVRSKGGLNNNPTARQFESIYKRLLIHSEIKGVETANVIALDNTSILHVGSSSSSRCVSSPAIQHDHKYSMKVSNLSNTLFKTNPTNIYYISSELLGNEEDKNSINTTVQSQDHDYIGANIWHLTTYASDIVSYIAGFVVRKVKEQITCSYCLNLLEDEEGTSLLQKRKTFGKLINASPYVINVCKCGEHYFRYLKENQNIFNISNNIIKILINKTLSNLRPNLLNVFGDHIYDHDPISNHSILLTELILIKYFDLRLYHEVTVRKDVTEFRVRSLLTKTITFKNQ